MQSSKIPRWYAAVALEHFDALYNAGQYLTCPEAALIVKTKRSAAGYFMRWFRDTFVPQHLSAKSTLTPPVPLENLSLPAALVKGAFVDSSGTVYTDLGPDFGMVILSQGEFRSLRRDYSKLWGGGATSQTDLSYKYRFPSRDAVEAFIKIHGFRQNSIPFTDEELLEENEDALVGKALESRRQSFLLKLQTQERVREKRDAEKWRTFEVNAGLVAAELRGMAVSEPLPVYVHEAAQPFALIISISDLHLGKAAYDHAGEQVYNRAEAHRRAVAATRDLLQNALTLGRPDEIQVVICSDGIQVDGPGMTTTKGSSMAGQTDGSYREMMRDYVALMLEIAKICRAVAPTKLLAVEGNHDRTSAMLIGMLLEQAFVGDPRVSVERQFDDGLIVLEYGANTLAYLHGEFLKSHKDLFKVLLHATRERGLEFHRHAFSFSGHLHGEASQDLGGIKHHTLSALCGADEWHRRSFFVGNTEEAQAFVIRRSGGKASTLYSHPDVLKR